MTNKTYTLSVSSPSNIAFVKYWGKRPVQRAINPSFSMGLSHCKTVSDLYFTTGGDELRVEVGLDGVFSESFSRKAQRFIDKSTKELFGLKGHLKVETYNTFPHSAGIASSASGMSALSFGLAHFISHLGLSSQSVLDIAGPLSRLASGSACRSLYGPWASWGELSAPKDKALRANWLAPDQGMELKNIHPRFQDLCNSILIFSDREKSISSTQGHELLESSYYLDSRVQQAFDHYDQGISFLENGDWDGLGQLLEAEALSLHALMMSGKTGFILLEPVSIAAIHFFRKKRELGELNAYFTFDAGPNMHLVYPASEKEKALSAIDEFFLEWGRTYSVIHDKAGVGPEVIAPLTEGTQA